MGKKKTNGKAYVAELCTLSLRLTEGPDQLDFMLGNVAPGLCSLVDAALAARDEDQRLAARYLVMDLRTIALAGSAAEGGREVEFREKEIPDQEAPDHALRLVRLVQIEQLDGCEWTEQALAARENIAERLENLIRSLSARTNPAAEARA